MPYKVTKIINLSGLDVDEFSIVLGAECPRPIPRCFPAAWIEETFVPIIDQITCLKNLVVFRLNTD